MGMRTFDIFVVGNIRVIRKWCLPLERSHVHNNHNMVNALAGINETLWNDR